MTEKMTKFSYNFDLRLALRRLKADWKNRCFISHPFLLMMIEQEEDGWLDYIASRLSRGYTPSPAIICYEPKPGWLLRPGCTLRIDDELVYTAVIGSLLPIIEPAIRWSQGNPDTSYVLPQDPNTTEWVQSGFRAWDNFRKESLAAARRSEFVVSIDIAAFYENIDIGRLISDVRNLRGVQNEIDLLSACLNRWSEPRGKGIPQGYTASDILAKLYLDSVDQAIKSEGFKHIRYVDDIRVFCSNLHEAKGSLRLIIDRLRLRGLNIQSAKTKILRADKAITDIDGVAPVIKRISEELADELNEFGAEIGYSINLQELSRIISENPTSPSIDVLNRAFTSHFIESVEDNFDRTLFHYLLTRLGLLKSRVAVDFCLDQLHKRPEETRFILKYFRDIKPDDPVLSSVILYAHSQDASNEFQKYQILKFLHEENVNCDGTLDLARSIIRDRNLPLWLRSYAYAIVGRLGTVADLEYIESIYPIVENELEKVDIICSLFRFEQTRRNAILARSVNDGILIERAVKLVRQNRITSRN